MESGRKTSLLTEYMFYKAEKFGLPLSGTFELTPMCNFSCRMCYVRKTAEEVGKSSRPMRTLGQWLDLAREARDAGMLYLLLTGGEPTIFPGFWELYEELMQMGLVVSINTNGSMLDEGAVERLSEYPPRRVNITLYGAGDRTYEDLCGVKGMFSRVDGSIRRLREAGIQVKLNCSLTPYNAADLEAMAAYAKDRDLILDIATYMFPPLRRDSAMVGQNERFTPAEAAFYRMKSYKLQFDEAKYRETLLKIQKESVPPPGLSGNCPDPMDGKIRCRAGKASFWATWDGWLSLCGMMPEPRADLLQGTFTEAWEELRNACDHIRVSGVCKRCPNSQLCHACAAMAQTETGSTAGIPAYLCETAEEMRRLAEEELAEERSN